MYTLINVLSEHLFQLLESSRFPSVQHQSNIPVPLSIKKTWTGGNTLKNGEDPTREALNCVRVLGRVLVVVYENSEDDVVNESLRSRVDSAGPNDAQLREHFADTLWQSGGKSPVDEQPQDEANRAGTAAETDSSSLMEKLFKCTIDLLFCAGFTIPESAKGQSKDKINVSCVAQCPALN